MVICHNVNFEGFNNLTLKITPHALERIQASRLSLGKVFKLLRDGSFELVSTTNKRRWTIRAGQIDLVIDSVLGLVVTLVITAHKRIFVPKPTLGSSLPQELQHRIKQDMMLKSLIEDESAYIGEFVQMLNHKEIE